MSEFPEEGLYSIMSGPFTATVLKNENVLRGEPIDDSHVWSLKYDVNSDSGFQMCSLKDVETGGYLGVKSIENFQPVYRLDEGQGWFLRKTEDGYTISRLSGYNEYFWYLGGDGEQIVISDKESKPQSWVFTKMG